jgi:MFS family permease
MSYFRWNLLLYLVFLSPASAQDSNPITGSLLPPSGWRQESTMVAAFILFGLIVVVMQFVLFYRAREQISATDVTRSFVTTLVVIAVVALVGLGYNAQQIQPAIALFGTIIGYFVGRETRPTMAAPARGTNDSTPSKETQNARQR